LPLKIFISHAAADAPLAKYLEETLINLDQTVTVFRTSRPAQLTAGVSWFREIEDNLRAATAYLVVLTPNSVDRPWILFETGAAWFSNRTLVPAVAGLERSTIKEPLRLLQLLSIENPAEAKVVFERFNLVHPDIHGFCSAVRAIVEALPTPEGTPHWDEVILNGRRYVWGGPLHTLADGSGTPLSDSVNKGLTEAGLKLRAAPINDPDGSQASKGYIPIYWVDDYGAKHRLWTAQQVLYVKPDSPA